MAANIEPPPADLVDPQVWASVMASSQPTSSSGTHIVDLPPAASDLPDWFMPSPPSQSAVVPSVPDVPAAIPAVVPSVPDVPAAIPAVVPSVPDVPAAIPAVVPSVPDVPAAIPAVVPSVPDVPAAIPAVVPNVPDVPAAPFPASSYAQFLQDEPCMPAVLANTTPISTPAVSSDRLDIPSPPAVFTDVAAADEAQRPTFAAEEIPPPPSVEIPPLPTMEPLRQQSSPPFPFPSPSTSETGAVQPLDRAPSNGNSAYGYCGYTPPPSVNDQFQPQVSGSAPHADPPHHILATRVGGMADAAMVGATRMAHTVELLPEAAEEESRSRPRLPVAFVPSPRRSDSDPSPHITFGSSSELMDQSGSVLGLGPASQYALPDITTSNESVVRDDIVASAIANGFTGDNIVQQRNNYLQPEELSRAPQGRPRAKSIEPIEARELTHSVSFGDVAQVSSLGAFSIGTTEASPCSPEKLPGLDSASPPPHARSATSGGVGTGKDEFDGSMSGSIFRERMVQNRNTPVTSPVAGSTPSAPAARNQREVPVEFREFATPPELFGPTAIAASAAVAPLLTLKYPNADLQALSEQLGDLPRTERVSPSPNKAPYSRASAERATSLERIDDILSDVSELSFRRISESLENLERGKTEVAIRTPPSPRVHRELQLAGSALSSLSGDAVSRSEEAAAKSIEAANTCVAAAAAVLESVTHIPGQSGNLARLRDAAAKFAAMQQKSPSPARSSEIVTSVAVLQKLERTIDALQLNTSSPSYRAGGVDTNALANWDGRAPLRVELTPEYAANPDSRLAAASLLIGEPIMPYITAGSAAVVPISRRCFLLSTSSNLASAESLFARVTSALRDVRLSSIIDSVEPA